MRRGYKNTTRRAFLGQLASSVAWPLALSGTLPRGAFAAPACGANGPRVTLKVGRAGRNCLQLLIEHRQLDLPLPVEVGWNAKVDWAPDADDRFGGMGARGVSAASSAPVVCAAVFSVFCARLEIAFWSVLSLLRPRK